MIRAGDELSQSKEGNNNTYCLDNDLTWLNWNLDEREKDVFEICAEVRKIWREQPVLQRRNFFNGRAIRGDNIKDISFFDPSGREMNDEAWNAGFVRSIGVRLAGDIMSEVDDRGEPIFGDTLLLLINAHWETIDFTLPQTKPEHSWQTMVDTVKSEAPPRVMTGGELYSLHGRSLALLRTTRHEEAGLAVSSAQIATLRKRARRTAPPRPNSPPMT